jgi:4-amino-4-deoxy-L-arabinose transferase-like glycosyltransferase
MSAIIPASPKFSAAIIFKGLLIASIILLFTYRASDTLVSDHATGDQRAYLGIAMKLDRFGFRQYNLYHIDRIHSDGGVEYVYSSEPDGELIKAFRMEGLGFFGQPYYHTPPLISYLLLFSHRIFSPNKGYRVLFPAAANEMGLRQRVEIQFYSSFVAVFFGIVLLISTFLLARTICDYWTAAITMFLVAISPAVILASERVWQDIPLAALTAVAVLLLLRYFQSKNPTYFVLSVVSYACALLTKNTAILLVPTLLLIAVYFSYQHGNGIERALVNSILTMGLFFLLVMILTFPWYYTAFSTWGAPFYNSGQAGISKAHFSFIFSKSRPWYTYLVSLPSMLPLYLLGYYRIVRVLVSRTFSKAHILAIWFLSFFVALTVITHFNEQLGPDSRYMLLAYPPLAILTTSQLLRLRDWLASTFSRRVAHFAIVVSLIICTAWSYRLSDPSYAEFPQVYNHFMNMPW